VKDNSWNGRERNHVFLNRGDGSFAEVGLATGLGAERDGRGVAVADFDRDGDMEIVINNYRKQATFHDNRMAGDKGWLSVRLQGTTVNRAGVGAEVVATVGERTLTRLVGSYGYAGQHSLEAHIGLDGHAGADDLSVRWPDGSVEAFGPAVSGSRTLLVQGQGTLEKPAVVVAHQTPEKSVVPSDTAAPLQHEKAAWWWGLGLAGLLIGAVGVFFVGRRRE
jgi:enediyne biosynthesis protein E4